MVVYQLVAIQMMHIGSSILDDPDEGVVLFSSIADAFNDMVAADRGGLELQELADGLSDDDLFALRNMVSALADLKKAGA